MKNMLQRIRLFRVIQDISNFFFILKTIRKNKNSARWNSMKLRNGWLGTIGTVINLPPDVFQGEEIYYQVYVVEQMKPINRYLESLNLAEIVYPRTESLINPEKGEYAFLIKYKPLLRDFTWWWIISRGIFWYLVYFLETKFSLFSKLYFLVANYVSNFYEWLQTYAN